jgi:hypothetical protein
MTAEILKFPKATFVLTCKTCGSHDFEIHLGSDDPGDMVGYECSGCGMYWDVSDISDYKARKPNES